MTLKKSCLVVTSIIVLSGQVSAELSQAKDPNCTTCPAAAETTTSAAPSAKGRITWLSSLDISGVRQGWGKIQVDKAVTGKSLSVGGTTFQRGVGTHASSSIWVELNGGTDRFQSVVGVDDAANGPGSVRFTVYGDGRKLWQSRVLSKGTSQTVSVAMGGVRTMLLKVDAGGDGVRDDNADWADAKLIGSGAEPRTIAAPRDDNREILTPPPSATPRINSSKVYGCRPGHPFLYRIPANGERPMKFTAEGLPKGIALDENAGILSGTAPPRGEYKISFRATNSRGKDSREFRIISGDKISLTPYMGWNHWYAHYHEVSDSLVRRAADTIVSSGMADAGYDYVCIDDCWMNAPKHKDPKRVGPLRDEKGDIRPNSYFPDMPALTAYIHGKGLKAGIYSSPGPLTCGQFGASYQHEAQDAAMLATWGFDLFKYDWCSYGKIAPKPPSLDDMQKPYKLMGDLLKQQKRDIVFNLCQYGMGDVWQWGAQVHAQSWRTAGDLGYELNRIFEVAQENARHRAYNGPGTWNDPDYLQIGLVGDVHDRGEKKRGMLSPTEEYAFMSLWCLSAAPLVYSGDMDNLDAFTTGVLCNPEAIEVNQDPLGQCAAVVPLEEGAFLMIKDMEDGSKAVGLCNGGEFETTLRAPWSVLGLRGKQRIRDLWRHKDLGEYDGEFIAPVQRHGVVMVRMYPVSTK